MSLFVDASAVVAMLGNETDALEIAGRLRTPGDRLWSAIVRWEITAALARLPTFGPDVARSSVLAFGSEWSFTLVPIGEREDEIAHQAYRTYGKGTGHPAQLNMGDCFAYACAKAYQAKLLYKGDDFSHTDLA